MLLQVLAIALILAVAVEFASAYPAGLPLWRFWASMLGMTLLLGLNVLFTRFAGKPDQQSRWDWPALAFSAALVFFITWTSSQISYVYVLSLVCGQVTFRRGVWPSGGVFGGICLLAWLALQIVLRSALYSILSNELALATGVIFVLVLTSLINRLRRANRELDAAHARNMELAVAEERLRLARDLHDSVTQELYSVSLYAEAAVEQLSAGESQTAISHLHDVQETARRALREMRLLVFDLHPPALAASGLADALQARLDAVERRSGVSSRLLVEGCLHLTPEVEHELYNIVREALNNVLKHAHATEVKVLLCGTDSGSLVEVRDNGIGFSAESQQGGLGIRGMRERAEKIGALLTFTSQPGKGATVVVRVPMVGAG